ncbi:hypothetical protein DVQ33_08985 [Yersinia enterocolitica]|nr:hypothetical protein [Yersinia enterocolitica]EKN6112574.1 hypothetical protein [Yersinia enterocolitica]
MINDASPGPAPTNNTFPILIRITFIADAVYTRQTSSCICVGCTHSPESLTRVSSSGFSRLPPSCNSNYLAYMIS